MLTKFLLEAQSAPQALDQAAAPGLCDFHTYKLSMGAGGIENPITLIQTISKTGVGLKRAHDIVSLITDGETVELELADTSGAITTALKRLGVEATRV